jgi:alpha-beta hydrolase superfamily lysophospholipase
MAFSSKISKIKNQQVFISTFLPDGAPKAIIQINHGLAEHSLRYYDFAEYLVNKGFGVYLHDHPGHGKTAETPENLGHLNWKSGWDNLLEIINNINKTIRKAHPNVPVFLMGHSMGSLLARYYNAAFPMYFKGMIIVGTTHPDPSTLKGSLLLIKLLRIFHKDTHKSKWFNTYFYKRLNSSTKKSVTRFDWLSSDPHEVQKYIDDPLCGFELSIGFFKNILQGTLQMLKTEKQLKFRKNFATLIISGKQDPSGRMGKDPKTLKSKYVAQGFFNTHLKLIEGRHELLNEREEIRNQTYEIIAEWMDEKLKGSF